MYNIELNLIECLFIHKNNVRRYLLCKKNIK